MKMLKRNRRRSAAAVVNALESRVLFATYYVDFRSQGVTGTSWDDAFPNLASAIAVLQPNDTIKMSRGNYAPEGNTGTLSGSVHILGGYAGQGAADPELRSGTTVFNGVYAPVVLENGMVFQPEPAETSLVFNGGASLQLDGLSFQNFRGGTSEQAVVQLRGILGGTVINCSFLNNGNANGGGAIYAEDTQMNFREMTFNGNTARTGGALHFQSSATSGVLPSYFINNSQFIGNNATNGGAIAQTGLLQFVESTDNRFNGNRAAESGGAIYTFGFVPSTNMIAPGAGVTLKNTVFEYNSAGERGGAVAAFTTGKVGAFMESSFVANSAPLGGAIALGITLPDENQQPVDYHPTFTAYKARFEGNVADAGGAIYNESVKKASLSDASFVLNRAGVYGPEDVPENFVPAPGTGAAIENTAQGSVDVDFVTFAGNVVTNSSADAGGAIRNSGVLRVSNSIFWQNDSTDAKAVATLGDAATTITTTIVDAASSAGGTAIFLADPKFVRNPGTNSANDAGDLRLGSFSPALDAGDLALAFTVGKDQNNSNGRVVQGASADLGALEGEVDTAPPISSVVALPALTKSNVLMLAWSVADEKDPVHQLSFTIYVSVDGSDYQAIESLTDVDGEDEDDLVGEFAVESGHVYRFYSRATDRNGNVEPAPTVADAETLVDTAAPVSAVGPIAIQTTTTDISLTFVGNDSSIGSGIASYALYVSDNGGAFTLAASGLTATTYVYSGLVDGHTYGFATVATDVAGNVESLPQTADAVTTAVFNTPLVTETGSGSATGNLQPSTVKLKLPKLVNNAVIGGSVVSGTLTVVNAGTGAATGALNVTFYLSTDETVSSKDRLLVTATGKKPVNLKAGGKTVLPFSFTVPANFSGTANILAYVNPPLDGVPAIAETTSLDNASVASTFTVAPAAVNLMAGAITTKAPAAGKAGKASILVTNTGNQTATGDLLLTTSVLDTLGLSLSSSDFTKKIKLAAGKSVKVTLPYTAPATSGAYVLRTVVDPANAFSQTLVTDDVRTATLTVG